MSHWLIPFIDLTTDQQEAVEMPSRAPKVIMGGPGSGKTLTLLHRATYLKQKKKASNDDFRIMVFTNVLKNYISDALEVLEIPEENIITFDLWCKVFYKEHISKRLPWNTETRSPDFLKVRQGVGNYLEKNKVAPIYKFILVDEAQDLDADSFSLMQKLAKHVTVCLDHKQQLYDTGSSENQILKKLGIERRNKSLLGVYRCCPYLVQVARHFIGDEKERKIFLNQAETSQGEKEKPLLYLADDLEQEKKALVEGIRHRLAAGDQMIGIILPQNRQVYGFHKGLSEAGIDVELVGSNRQGDITYSFNNSRPKIMTYHAAKGLTFDSVFLPRIHKGSFTNVEEQRMFNMLFVGITRATKWVAFSGEEDKMPTAVLDLLKACSSENLLSLQRGDDLSWAETEIDNTDFEADSEDDDFLLDF